MKQRLALARCLVHDPLVLILDEPASGLDPRARAEMKEIVRHLGRMGKTVLISSHILPELGEICDRVAIMENGRVVVAGTVGEVTEAGGGSRQIVVEVSGRAGELALLHIHGFDPSGHSPALQYNNSVRRPLPGTAYGGIRLLAP